MQPEKHDDERKELLDELAKRFLDSAKTLRDVAKRMSDVSADSAEQARTAREARHALGESLAPKRERRPHGFSYLEYLEFSSVEEFRRFRDLPPVSDAELAAVNMDDLCEHLLNGA